MRGQIFIVTVIFLVGLVYMAQQVLFQYAFLDEPTITVKNDAYLFSNIKEQIANVIRHSESCEGPGGAVEGLERYMNHLSSNPPPGGYVTTISYTYDCDNWWNAEAESDDSAEALFNIILNMVSGGMETSEGFHVYRFDGVLRLDFQSPTGKLKEDPTLIYTAFSSIAANTYQTLGDLKATWQTGGVENSRTTDNGDALYEDLHFLVSRDNANAEYTFLIESSTTRPGPISKGKPFVRIYSYNSDILGSEFYCGTIYAEDIIRAKDLQFGKRINSVEFYPLVEGQTLEIRFKIPRKTADFQCTGFPVNGMDIFY